MGVAHETGIGLTSMRQRATDLGGQCTVGPAEPAGMIVRAWLLLEVTG
jgi:signal transduction histidine kinase